MRTVKLKECCLVKGGFAFKSESYEKKGIPLIRITNIVNQKIKLTNNTVFIDKNDYVYSNEYFIKRGDILVALSGATTGKFGVFELNEKALLNQRVALIRVYNELVHQKFIYYYFFGLESYIFKKAQGVAQPNISTKELEEFKIPLPPLTEQKRIAEILDKADSIRQKRKESIALLDEFLRSVFLDMFGDPVRNEKGWENTKIKNQILNIKNENPKSFPDQIYNYIDISSIDNTCKKIISTNLILGKNAPSRARQKVQANDILISTVRPNLNAVALVTEGYKNPIASTGFCVLRVDKSKVNAFYLFEIAKKKFFVDSLTKIAKGASYPAVSDNDIKELSISFPPIILQTQFAKIVEQVEATKAKMEESLKEMDNQFNGLLQRVFK